MASDHFQPNTNRSLNHPDVFLSMLELTSFVAPEDYHQVTLHWVMRRGFKLIITNMDVR